MPTKIEWTEEIIDRFWQYVRKTAGCWIWIGGCFSNGYGQFRVAEKKVKAHRFAYQITKGNILPGICVCHTCDNRKCVNPNHLFLATHKGNALDRANKKRSARFNLPRLFGEKNPQAKLTQSKVEEIRELRKSGYTYRSLACKFEVSCSLIGNIIRDENWKSKIDGG